MGGCGDGRAAADVKAHIGIAGVSIIEMLMKHTGR